VSRDGKRTVRKLVQFLSHFHELDHEYTLFRTFDNCQGFADRVFAFCSTDSMPHFRLEYCDMLRKRGTLFSSLVVDAYCGLLTL
jgi:hypothetical protein